MQRFTRNPQMRRYLWRASEVALLLVFIVVVVLLFSVLMKFILPFLVGFLLAILLSPLVVRLEKLRIPRLASVLTVLISSVILLVIAFLGVVLALVREVASLGQNSSGYLRKGNAWVAQEMVKGRLVYGRLPSQVAAELQSTFSHVTKSIEVSITNFATSIVSLLTHFPETMFIFAIAVITAFFVLLRREKMLARFFRLMPPGWGSKLELAFHDMSRAFAGTIRVQVILMILSAVLGAIGLGIMHFPYAVLLGLIFGLFGIIPILGSAIMTIPWAVGAFMIGDVSAALKILLLQLVVSLIRHLAEPKILADSVGLDTLSTLFALYVGLQWIGVVGLFIGPIILIGAKSLLRTRLFVDWMPDEAAGNLLLPSVGTSQQRGPTDETR